MAGARTSCPEQQKRPTSTGSRAAQLRQDAERREGFPRSAETKAEDRDARGRQNPAALERRPWSCDRRSPVSRRARHGDPEVRASSGRPGKSRVEASHDERRVDHHRSRMEELVLPAHTQSLHGRTRAALPPRIHQSAHGRIRLGARAAARHRTPRPEERPTGQVGRPKSGAGRAGRLHRPAGAKSTRDSAPAANAVSESHGGRLGPGIGQEPRRSKSTGDDGEVGMSLHARAGRAEAGA
eukprot:scaffold109_cov252-Pinguiococcus_pyrenoidosus.AAC.26